MPNQVQIPGSCPCLEQGPDWLPVKLSGTCSDVQSLEQFTAASIAPESERTNQQQKELTEGVKEASLRGRKLKGCTVALPDGYKGFVLQCPYDDGEEKPFTPASHFKAVTYWNHDSTPSRLDAFKRALDWLSIAKQVQASVSPEDVEEAIRQATVAAAAANAVP